MQAQQITLELSFDKVTAGIPDENFVRKKFMDKEECKSYLRDVFLPQFQKKGYLEVSVDTLIEDSSVMKALVHVGPVYSWGIILVDSSLQPLEADVHEQLNIKRGDILSLDRLLLLKDMYLSALEENGYPFASVQFDSSYFLDNQLYAKLNAVKGPLYSIDSINVEGKVKISTKFLIQYLKLGDGSVYKKSLLSQVSDRIAQLGFVRETRKWTLSLTGTGAMLNLFLESAQNSRFNLLAGFMPDNQQLGGKLLLTGEAEMDLKNAFGSGENIYVNWQQIQVRSPRLQLGFMKPYLLAANTGLDFNFNLLRKDSSFLTLNTKIGLRYEIGPRQVAKVFFQQYSSSLLEIDTTGIKQTGRLPEILDVKTANAGIEINYNNTDYFLNPQRGLDLEVRLLGGVRNIGRNNAITQLKGANQAGTDFSQLYDSLTLRSAQFRFNTKISHYYKLGRQSTLKSGLQAGWIFGKEILLNEMFQIGGIRTLRGFDEESIFSSGYGIATLEYRYLLSRASYLFGFTDAAFIERNTISQKKGNFYAGLGVGITLETKNGMFSLAYAAGKRPNAPINVREAKIHFGFVTLF